MPKKTEEKKKTKLNEKTTPKKTIKKKKQSQADTLLAQAKSLKKKNAQEKLKRQLMKKNINQLKKLIKLEDKNYTQLQVIEETVKYIKKNNK